MVDKSLQCSRALSHSIYRSKYVYAYEHVKTINEKSGCGLNTFRNFIFFLSIYACVCLPFLSTQIDCRSLKVS